MPFPLKSLRQSKLVSLGRPASNAQIAAAERELGVVFPAAYRSLLRAYGVMQIGERSVFGVGGRGLGSEESVVYQTQYYRSVGYVRLPEHFVVLWNEGHTDCECLDSRGGADGPVVQVERATGARGRLRVRELSTGLADWLEQKVNEQIKEKRLFDLITVDRPRRRRATR